MSLVALLAVQTVQRSIGYVILAVVVIGGFFFAWSQIRKGRPEVGSEVELAPNRKPYLPDAELEGPKLNVALWSSAGLLAVIALSLPLYWLAEGGRQQGAIDDYQAIFEIRGQDIYQNLAKCEGCHGPKGVGGQAPYVITDENAKFVAEVNWNAPALNTVLWRFSEAEVKDIITYGRPGTPMQPWGVAGGGALSDQQLDNVIDYLWSFQLTEAAMHTQVLDAVKAHAPELEARLADVIKANEPLLKDPLAYECETGTYVCLDQADQLRLGEILFNLNDVAAGAYSCSRCHVPGASYGEPWQPIDKIGRGRYGPNLIGIERDMTVKQHYDLVMKGTEDGRIYGANHQGSGRMPGFGINPNTGDPKRPPLGNGGMYQPEEVWAIVQYERNMSTQFADIAKIVGTSTSSTTTTVPVSAVAANTGAKP